MFLCCKLIYTGCFDVYPARRGIVTGKGTSSEKSMLVVLVACFVLKAVELLNHQDMIREFRKEYKWLSNFSPCEIQFNGMLFSSVEHAYMSAKSDDLEWKSFCGDASNSPGRVKKKSREITLRNDWDSIKVGVMRELLQQKFSQKPYKELLLDTGTQFIQEGNRWGDTFWGVDLKTNTGENNLGVLLMEIRETLQKEQSEGKLYRRVLGTAKGFIRRLLRL